MLVAKESEHLYWNLPIKIMIELSGILRCLSIKSKNSFSAKIESFLLLYIINDE